MLPNILIFIMLEFKEFLYNIIVHISLILIYNLLQYGMEWADFQDGVIRAYFVMKGH